MRRSGSRFKAPLDRLEGYTRRVSRCKIAMALIGHVEQRT